MMFVSRIKSVAIGLSFLVCGTLLHPTAFAVQSNPPTSDPPSGKTDNLLMNGDFADWNDSLPVGWKIGIGATDGANQPKSSLKKGAGPSIELSGNSKTKAWQFLSQSIDVQPNSALKISFSGKSKQLKRQSLQKDNCYLGFVPKNEQGQSIEPQFWNVMSPDYDEISNLVQVPANVDKAEIWIFLSKSGTLNVKDVTVTAVDPQDSFDILVEDFARNYSFLDLKKIDWKSLSDRYRDRAEQADSPKKFAQVVASMLAELNDMHTWVMFDDVRYSEFKSEYEPNSDFHVLARSLVNPSPYQGLGVFAKTDDGICYVNFRTLTLPMPLLMRQTLEPDFKPSDRPLKEILQKIAANASAPGLILDLRQNSGGDERIAKQIAGMFVDRETEYAQAIYRQGGPTEFGPPNVRSFQPTGNVKFKGAVVCLIGPGTVSSAEGLAMMMKAVPNCTLVGQPTRGASGNPRPVFLPNGVQVWYSRWKSLLPDGTCIEEVGIQPDQTVVHQPGSDKTFDRAIEIINQNTK